MATGFGHVAGTGQFRGYGSPGTRSTGAYMIGARPFIVGGTIDAGDTLKVSFPYVTRLITVINKDADSHDMRIHFSNTNNDGDAAEPGWRNGLHYITLDSKNQSMTFNVRAKEIFISAADDSNDVTFELFAELTDINSARMHTYDSTTESDIPATGYEGTDTAKAARFGNDCSSEVTEAGDN